MSLALQSRVTHASQLSLAPTTRTRPDGYAQLPARDDVTTQPSPNFGYLAHHDPRLVALGTQDEEHYATNPATCLAKLRLFAEVLAKRAAAKVGLLPYPGETQQTLVDRLFDESVIGATQRSLFHDLRRIGNAAVHEGETTRARRFSRSRWHASCSISSSRTSTRLTRRSRPSRCRNIDRPYQQGAFLAVERRPSAKAGARSLSPCQAPGTGTYKIVVSDHVDPLREVVRGYGKHGSRPPADYLEAFRAFVTSNMNALPALLVVTQRPRDLKREDLRRLELALDLEGFGETSVQTAWREQMNEDIAATIIGYIRKLALGSPLVPYGERVDRAVAKLKQAHKFTTPQVTWLQRIADQVKIETVVDRDSLDRRAFVAHGGFARMNKVFDGTLDARLGELADEVWKDAG